MTEAVIDELTSSMNYVRPEYGSADVSQVRILQDLLPVVQVFSIIRGLDPAGILSVLLLVLCSHITFSDVLTQLV